MLINVFYSGNWDLLSVPFSSLDTEKCFYCSAQVVNKQIGVMFGLEKASYGSEVLNTTGNPRQPFIIMWTY